MFNCQKEIYMYTTLRQLLLVYYRHVSAMYFFIRYYLLWYFLLRGCVKMKYIYVWFDHNTIVILIMIKQYLMIKVGGWQRKKKGIFMQHVVLITIYTYFSLFKNCNSGVNKTSLIIRSYPEVDMWAPFVLQEYGRLRAYLFRLLYHLLPS